MVGEAESVENAIQVIGSTKPQIVFLDINLGNRVGFDILNEIKSELNGEILEVLVKNGQPIEFDQPLFKIKKG